jgi:hypothetical protein
MTGAAKNTVLNLVLDLADARAAYHDRNVRSVKVRRLQCDEIWQFVGSKARNASPEKKAIGWGDVSTWTGLDAERTVGPRLELGRTTRLIAKANLPGNPHIQGAHPKGQGRERFLKW